MSNPYTTPSYMMVIGSVLAIGAASQLVRGGSRSMHRDDCATQIDHTLRCTCARERAWERSAHAGGGMTPAELRRRDAFFDTPYGRGVEAGMDDEYNDPEEF